MNRDVPEVFLAGGDLVPQGHTRRCLSVVESREQLEEEEEEEEAEEEKKKEGDGFHDVPLRRSGAFRAHSHNYDPFKRHSWGPGRELQDSLSRNKPQASGCEGPQKDPLQWSQEELDPFLELQHRGGQPSCVVRTDNSPWKLPPSSPSPDPLPIQPPLCASSVLPAVGSLCPQASL